MWGQLAWESRKAPLELQAQAVVDGRSGGLTVWKCRRCSWLLSHFCSPFHNIFNYCHPDLFTVKGPEGTFLFLQGVTYFKQFHIPL